MYESILNQPYSLFGQFERLRRELDDVFGVSGLPNSIRSVAPGTFRRSTSAERPPAWRSTPSRPAGRLEDRRDARPRSAAHLR
jgi:hypothetical protein